MKFAEQFEGWLRQAFASEVPGEVRAFSFNLFEPAFVTGVKFGVELVGASRFDPNDPDWPCDEVWQPIQRQLNIPISFSGETWEQCLEAIKSLVENTLASHNHVADSLKSRLGVGVGFIDGDMHVVWEP